MSKNTDLIEDVLTIEDREMWLGNPSSNGQVLSSTTSGTRSWVDQSGGSGASGIGKNLLTNGGFDVYQKNPNGNTPVNSSGEYGVDRWYANDMYGTTVVFHQQDEVVGLAKSTISLAPGYAEQSIVAQPVENLAISCSGKTLTFSFWTNTSYDFVNDTKCVYKADIESNGNVAYTTILFTETGETYLGYRRVSATFVCPTGSIARPHLEVGIWQSVANNSITVTNAKLEIGDTATDFEYEPLADIMASCYAYFWKMPYGPLHQMMAITNGASNLRRLQLAFPVPMRGLPTVSGMEADLTAGTGTVVTLSVNQIDVSGCRVALSTNAIDADAIWVCKNGEFDAEI